MHGKDIAKLLNISGLELREWDYECLLKIRYVNFSLNFLCFFVGLIFEKVKKEKNRGSKELAHSIVVYIFLSVSSLFVCFIHLIFKNYFLFLFLL